jgi:predicted ABC-type ATPase
VRPPTVTFIAGPNGAGKSTLTSGNLDFFSAFPLLDPDVLANAIRPDNEHQHPLSAGRDVLEQIQIHLKANRSFAVETTLAGKVYLQTMLDAHRLGFRVCLIYIGTSDVSIHLTRVAQRVELKGHNVPEADIRRRYKRSLDNLLIAAVRSDLVILFDNSETVLEASSQTAYRLVAIIDNAGEPDIQWMAPLPAWVLPLKKLLERP